MDFWKGMKGLLMRTPNEVITIAFYEAKYDFLRTTKMLGDLNWLGFSCLNDAKERET